MKYLLFGGDAFYACGGWADFLGKFDSIHAARAEGIGKNPDWWHVVDVETGKIVAAEGRAYGAEDLKVDPQP